MNCQLYFEEDTDAVATETEGSRWVSNYLPQTFSGLVYRSSFSVLPFVPASFWRGLRDCEEGRCVDLDRALQEPFH